MIRAYRCAALDTPLAYIRKKIDPRPPGPWGRFLATGPDFGPKIRFLLQDPGFRRWSVCNPRRYLRFGTFGLIFSGRSAARRPVFRPPGRILARKSVFCYRTPDFVNGPFVALDNIFDLAPSGRFLVAVRPLGGPFSGHRAGFWPENPFFALGPRISSIARL